MTKRLVIFSAVAFIGGVACALADAPKPLKFWNLTSNTITELYLAPAGTQNWSYNLCLSDPDHTVDPDERLTLNGVAGGVYDVRVLDSSNRRCMFHGLDLKAQGPYAFAVSEQQMRDCKDR